MCMFIKLQASQLRTQELTVFVCVCLWINEWVASMVPDTHSKCLTHVSWINTQTINLDNTFFNLWKCGILSLDEEEEESRIQILSADQLRCVITIPKWSEKMYG